MKIKLIRIEDLKDFNQTEGFDLEPKSWGMSRAFFNSAFNQAKELALKEDGICIAFITSEELGEFALAEAPGQFFQMKAILFNAEKVEQKDGTIHGVIKNSEGVPIWEGYFQYLKGSIA